MGRPREGNYKTFTVNLDPAETDKFVQGLKHNQSLSEIFRDFIRDENRRIQSEKNLNAPNYGAIRVSKTTDNVTQSTLNRFIMLDSKARFSTIKEMDKRKRVELQVKSKEVITQCIAANKNE